MNLVSDNILLRAIEQDDCKFLKEMINDPETEKMVTGWSLPVSEKTQIDWINNLNSRDMKFIIDIDGEAVGMASITNVDFKNSIANLNIKIKETTYKGSATCC